MVHPRQLPLTLHTTYCLQVEATSAASGLRLSRRCSRALISAGIARYATIVSDTRPGYQSLSKEPPAFQNPYPYPTHPRPTPHQIFHLSPGATQDEIKKRCTFLNSNLVFPFMFIFFIIIAINKKQTTISFEHTTQIHVMHVFPPILQQKPIRDFDLSKLLTTFYKDARYRRTLMLAQRRLRKISTHTCMN